MEVGPGNCSITLCSRLCVLYTPCDGELLDTSIGFDPCEVKKSKSMKKCQEGHTSILGMFQVKIGAATSSTCQGTIFVRFVRSLVHMSLNPNGNGRFHRGTREDADAFVLEQGAKSSCHARPFCTMAMVHGRYRQCILAWQHTVCNILLWISTDTFQHRSSWTASAGHTDFFGNWPWQDFFGNWQEPDSNHAIEP